MKGVAHMKLAQIFKTQSAEDLVRLMSLLNQASEDDDIDEASTEAYLRLAESISQYLNDGLE